MGFCWSSTRAWIRDSSERRKKPSLVESELGSGVTTETSDTETVTLPVWVNPNFSKRIMGRSSLAMVRVLISAVVGQRRRERREMARKVLRSVLVILTAAEEGLTNGKQEYKFNKVVKDDTSYNRV